MTSLKRGTLSIGYPSTINVGLSMVGDDDVSDVSVLFVLFFKTKNNKTTDSIAIIMIVSFFVFIVKESITLA